MDFYVKIDCVQKYSKSVRKSRVDRFLDVQKWWSSLNSRKAENLNKLYAQLQKNFKKIKMCQTLFQPKFVLLRKCQEFTTAMPK